MSTPNFYKDRISAHRFAAGYYCGLHGYQLMSEDEKKFTHTGMIKGSYVDRAIRDWADSKIDYDLDNVVNIYLQVQADSLIAILPKRTDIDTSKEMTGLLQKSIPSVPLPFVGELDIVTKDGQVYEIKNGKSYEWHLIQADFYRWMIGSDKPAHVIYVSTRTKVEAPIVVTDEVALQVWENILSKTVQINSRCNICPILDKCPERVQPANELIQAAIANRQMLDRLQDMLKTNKQRFEATNEELIQNIKDVMQREEDLNKQILAMDNYRYVQPDKLSITVYEKEKLELPTNYLELLPYSEYPHFYDLVIKKEMLDDVLEMIGQKTPIPSLRYKVKHTQRKKK